MSLPAARPLFLNLPVEDLPRAVGFFRALGFEPDPRFSGETAACVALSASQWVMLHTHASFDGFAARPRSNPHETTAVLVALGVDTREDVDALADAALAAGATPATPAQDYGFMRYRTFFDPDGHHWEVVWMDPAGPPAEPPAA